MDFALTKVMERIGFGERWISWIMKFVSTLSHVVIINSASSYSFVLERGLRQGDPISLYL